jgi:hypothetical protein
VALAEKKKKLYLAITTSSTPISIPMTNYVRSAMDLAAPLGRPPAFGISFFSSIR